MVSSVFYMLLGIVAWVVATLGPLTIGVGFWHLAERVRLKWLINLLFIPCALLVEWSALLLLSFATGDNGDGPPGLGFALIPAFFLLILSLVGYFVVLAATQIKLSKAGE